MSKAKDGGYIGVQYARIALVKDGKAIAGDGGIPGADANGIYKITTSEDGGVATANITGLTPSIQRIWGNNQIADISVGKAQPSVAMGINFLRHDVLAAVLGRKSDSKGGYTVEGSTVDVAIEIVSNTVAGTDIHFGFYDGYVTPGELQLATNNENQTRVTDALTFSPFANDTGSFGKIYYSGDNQFDPSIIDKEIFGVGGTTAPIASQPANSDSGK